MYLKWQIAVLQMTLTKLFLIKFLTCIHAFISLYYLDMLNTIMEPQVRNKTLLLVELYNNNTFDKVFIIIQTYIFFIIKKRIITSH